MQHEGRRRWTKIGDADALAEAEARSQARTLLAGLRKGRESVPAQPVEIAFEAVADEVFSYYRRHWKPRTLAVNVNYYENHILPRFKGRPIAGIESDPISLDTELALREFGARFAVPPHARG